MPFAAINNYIHNQLAADVAPYLNNKVANFPNANQYFGGNGYFTEDTVKGVMFACLKAWLTNNENANHVLLVSEVTYPGFMNKADIAVVYDNGGGPQRIYIELKADFDADSVNADINLLDHVAGTMNSPLNQGYAFYVVRAGHAGWTQYIDPPTQANVHTVAINVN